MVITVTCPSCSSAFPVDPAKIPDGGVNARCTQCGDIFRVEKPEEAVAEPVMELPEVPAFVEPPAVAVDDTPVEDDAPALDDVPAVVDAPSDWVMENEEVAPPPLPDPTPAFAEPEPVPAFAEPESMPTFGDPEASKDPFAEPAPFESPAVVDEPIVAEPAAEPVAEAAPAPAEASGFTFGKRDPTDKAKRLARVLVSDMIMYNADRHQSALEMGTLVQDFEEEIDKSWKEYVEQVGEDMANGSGREKWTEALNDILAKGQDVF